MSVEDFTKKGGSMAQSSKHGMYVLCSANANRPWPEHLTLTGVKTWLHSRLPPGPCGGALDRKVYGCWASVPRGYSCRSQHRAFQAFAPPQHVIQTSCTACAPPGCTSPSPQFPVAGGQLGLGVRVWCCSAICSRSGNNLKLNPQLFGSLL